MFNKCVTMFTTDKSFLLLSNWKFSFSFPSFLLLLSHPPPIFVLSFFYPVFDPGRKTGISIMGKGFITGIKHNVIVEADGYIHGRLVMVNLKSA